MTQALFSPTGAFTLDIRARCEFSASVEVYRLRGGEIPRHPPQPVVEELSSGNQVEGNGWTVRVISVPQAQPYLESFGLRLDCPEGSFAYSGDAGPSQAFARLAAGCDVLVHMCYQISGTVKSDWARGAAGHLEVARLGRDAKARNLVVSHVSTQMDTAGVRERLIKEMEDIYEGNLYWGEDLMEIPVGGPAATGHRG